MKKNVLNIINYTENSYAATFRWSSDHKLTEVGAQRIVRREVSPKAIVTNIESFIDER